MQGGGGGGGTDWVAVSRSGEMCFLGGIQPSPSPSTKGVMIPMLCGKISLQTGNGLHVKINVRLARDVLSDQQSNDLSYCRTWASGYSFMAVTCVAMKPWSAIRCGANFLFLFFFLGGGCSWEQPCRLSMPATTLLCRLDGAAKSPLLQQRCCHLARRAVCAGVV